MKDPEAGSGPREEKENIRTGKGHPDDSLPDTTAVSILGLYAT
jgi:hypothetical protein